MVDLEEFKQYLLQQHDIKKGVVRGYFAQFGENGSNVDTDTKTADKEWIKFSNKDIETEISEFNKYMKAKNDSESEVDRMNSFNPFSNLYFDQDNADHTLNKLHLIYKSLRSNIYDKKYPREQLTIDQLHSNPMTVGGKRRPKKQSKRKSSKKSSQKTSGSRKSPNKRFPKPEVYCDSRGYYYKRLKNGTCKRISKDYYTRLRSK
jgi:hypothetical protein